MKPGAYLGIYILIKLAGCGCEEENIFFSMMRTMACPKRHVLAKVQIFLGKNVPQTFFRKKI